jgi:DNA-binding NarL/FixJ family response regulator
MSKRILVVEDEEDLRAILRDLLSANGYTVVEAVDGAESVAKAASERPDLVSHGHPAARALASDRQQERPRRFHGAGLYALRCGQSISLTSRNHGYWMQRASRILEVPEVARASPCWIGVRSQRRVYSR